MKERRDLAIAWTRVCRELGKALAASERCPDSPPMPPGLLGSHGNLGAELAEALNEMMVYRDHLRAWAELPPGDDDSRQAELTDEQQAMVEELDRMEDLLNVRGHSMHERERK